MSETVNSPDHYKIEIKSGGENENDRGTLHVEAIDLIANLPMCRGSAVRYLCRAGKKDPAKEIEDLEKAIKYIIFEIRRLNGIPISDSLTYSYRQALNTSTDLDS